MDEAVNGFVESLGSLGYPMPEDKLFKLFRKRVRKLQTGLSETLKGKVVQAYEEAKKVNIYILAGELQIESETEFLRLVRRHHSASLCLAQIRDMRTKLEIKLEIRAKKYIELTAQNYKVLNISNIASTVIRCALPVLLSEAQIMSLITPEAVSGIYERSYDLLIGHTQTELFDTDLVEEKLAYLIAPVEGYFEGLVDLERLPKCFSEKLLKKIGKLHMRNMLRSIELTFRTELKSCVPGQAMDWDIDPRSTKGQYMWYVASVAKATQPNAALGEKCLNRCITWSRYSIVPEDSSSSNALLECICRLFMGLIALRNMHSKLPLHTDGQIYVWMQRVLKAIYNYPKEKKVFENRFLDTFDSMLTEILMPLGYRGCDFPEIDLFHAPGEN